MSGNDEGEFVVRHTATSYDRDIVRCTAQLTGARAPTRDSYRLRIESESHASTEVQVAIAPRRSARAFESDSYEARVAETRFDAVDVAGGYVTSIRSRGAAGEFSIIAGDDDSRFRLARCFPPQPDCVALNARVRLLRLFVFFTFNVYEFARGSREIVSTEAGCLHKMRLRDV